MRTNDRLWRFAALLILPLAASACSGSSQATLSESPVPAESAVAVTDDVGPDGAEATADDVASDGDKVAEEAPTASRQTPDSGAPSDAPASNLYIEHRPGGSNEAAALELLGQLDDDPRRPPLPGTLVHLATATTPLGDAELFFWHSIVPGAAGEGELGCLVRYGGHASSSTCSIPLDQEPSGPLTSSGRGRVAPEPEEFEYSLHYATPDAAWLVVDTESGDRIVANVVNRSAYMAWTEPLGEPVRVALWSADEVELWSTDLG